MSIKCISIKPFFSQIRQLFYIILRNKIVTLDLCHGCPLVPLCSLTLARVTTVGVILKQFSFFLLILFVFMFVLPDMIWEIENALQSWFNVIQKLFVQIVRSWNFSYLLHFIIQLKIMIVFIVKKNVFCF